METYSLSQEDQLKTTTLNGAEIDAIAIEENANDFSHSKMTRTTTGTTPSDLGFDGK